MILSSDPVKTYSHASDYFFFTYKSVCYLYILFS